MYAKNVGPRAKCKVRTDRSNLLFFVKEIQLFNEYKHLKKANILAKYGGPLQFRKLKNLHASRAYSHRALRA